MRWRLRIGIMDEEGELRVAKLNWILGLSFYFSYWAQRGID